MRGRMGSGRERNEKEKMRDYRREVIFTGEGILLRVRF